MAPKIEQQQPDVDELPGDDDEDRTSAADGAAEDRSPLGKLVDKVRPPTPSKGPGRPKKGEPQRPPRRKAGPVERADNRMRRIREQTTQTFVDLGAGLTLALPTTGLYWTSNAQRTAGYLVALGEAYPPLLRYLEKVGPTSAVVGLVGIAAGTALAVGVDLGKVDPHAMIAQHTGVTKVYELIEQEEGPPNGAAHVAEDLPDFLRGPASPTAR